MNRRTFLASLGLGAAAIPLLTSKRARAAAPAAVPKRLIIYYFCGGVVMDSTRGGALTGARDGWRPIIPGYAANPGSNVTVKLTKAMLTPSLLPLASYVNNLLFVDNVGMVCAYTDPNRTKMNGHEPSACSGLTADYTKVNPNNNYPDGGNVSLDQFLASKIGSGSTIPSLSMQTGGNLYHSVFSAPLTRVVSVEDPLAVYTQDGMKGYTPVDNTAQVAAAQAQRKLVLDALDQRFAALQGKVATGDQTVLQQSRDALTTIGARPIAGGGGAACYAPAAPAAYLNKYGAVLDHSKEPLMLAAQMDLAVAAIACDKTRVVSIAHYTNYFNQFVPGVSATDYHGSIEHGSKLDGGRNAQMNAVLAFEMTQLAALIAKLQAVKETDGTSAFDNTTILCMNEFGDNTHMIEDAQPFLLIGGAKCGLNVGNYVSYPMVKQSSGQLWPQPHNNLYVSILNSAFGLNVTRFGSADCTGALANIAAP